MGQRLVFLLFTLHTIKVIFLSPEQHSNTTTTGQNAFTKTMSSTGDNPKQGSDGLNSVSDSAEQKRR